MEIEENKTFPVERIVKKRIVKRKVQYLIKWVDYPDSSNSWEPKENTPLNLIEAFEKQQKEQKRQKRQQKIAKRKRTKSMDNNDRFKSKKMKIEDDRDINANKLDDSMMVKAADASESVNVKIEIDSDDTATEISSNKDESHESECGYLFKVLAAKNQNGIVFFHIRWTDTNLICRIEASTAKELDIQSVIAFYEKNLVFCDEEKA